MMRYCTITAITVLALGLLIPRPAPAQTLEIWSVWADGSSGTGTLIRGPNGTVVLFDEGGGAAWATKCYDDVMSPNSISYIDYAIAGHYDSDHCGGLDNLWADMGSSHSNFGTYYDRGGSDKHDGSPIPSDYYNLVDGSGKRDTIKVDPPAQRSDIDLGSGATLTFLSVGATDTTDIIYIRGRSDVTTGISENNKSITALITYGGFDFYVGSDAEGTSELAIDDVVVTDLGRDVDILHVDHHGSETNGISSAEFFANMDPEVAFFSVWNNSFGHPRYNVVTRLQSVVEPDTERIIRLMPGDTGHADWAPETMSYCLTTQRHIYVTSDGSYYTVDTVDRSGGNDITDPDLINHPADEGGGGPTPTPGPTSTPTPTNPPGVVVNQVCPFSSPGEYVELFNNGNDPVNLNGWELNVYSGDYTFTASDVIPAKGFYLVSDTNPVSGVVPDVETNIGITDNGVNSFAQLLDDLSQVQDTVGWADSSLFEGTILGTLGSGDAWIRTTDGTDTDNNASDFSSIDVPNPRNSSDSPPSPTPTPTATNTPTPTVTPTQTPWNFPRRVNFQPPAAPTVAGYAIDDVNTYGTRGEYGWR